MVSLYLKRTWKKSWSFPRFSAPQLIRPEILPHGNLTCLHFLSMLNQMTSQGPNQKHKGQMWAKQRVDPVPQHNWYAISVQPILQMPALKKKYLRHLSLPRRDQYDRQKLYWYEHNLKGRKLYLWLKFPATVSFIDMVQRCPVLSLKCGYAWLIPLRHATCYINPSSGNVPARQWLGRTHLMWERMSRTETLNLKHGIM